ILSGIHVARAALRGESGVLRAAAGDRFSALRGLSGSDRSLGVRRVLRGDPIVTVAYDGATPLSVRTRALARCSVVPGVRVVGLGHAAAAIRAVRGGTASIRSGVRVIGSSPSGATVRSVNSARGSVGSRVGVIKRAITVSDGIGTVYGISVRRV